MRPLSLVAAGFVLVAVDFRTRAADFLPDVVGWLLVVLGAVMIRAVAAALTAGAAAVLSLGELTLPYRLVRFDRERGVYLEADTPGTAHLPAVQRWDDLSDLHGVVIAAAASVGAVAILLLLRCLAGRARDAHDAAAVRELRLARAAPIAWAGPFVVLAAAATGTSKGYDPVWNTGAESFGLIAVLSLLGLGVLLTVRRDRGWALAPGAERASPWQQRRPAAGPVS